MVFAVVLQDIFEVFCERVQHAGQGRALPVRGTVHVVPAEARGGLCAHAAGERGARCVPREGGGGDGGGGDGGGGASIS